MSLEYEPAFELLHISVRESLMHPINLGVDSKAPKLPYEVVSTGRCVPGICPATFQSLMFF